MSAMVQDLNTARATVSTGPQVFHSVHWNMACSEKMSRMYHRLLYTVN